ncbi:hypothetical protein JNA55_24350 [Salmonella enterica subsp. enterica serovar Typhimurium]|uniref:hypothetical protein n=1 Tax=Salmonella enterica TaxID=28901 RepID=UPI00192CFBB9|nr:hypothetical protein [Salmonella enterica]MBL6093178.1 hypothetical protein [Salmonella enterica subsp. enterica serovar Typhimurium]
MTKKSVPHCIVHAGMNGLFFLTTELHQKYIKITSLLRQIAGVQQNYIKSTSKLHHFYVRSRVYNRITSKVHQKYIKITSLLRHFYIIFTSDLTSELFVHPPLFLGLLHVLKMVFPAVPATPHGHAINCVPVHRFRIRRTSETGLTPAEWCEIQRYALARILMHAVKTEPARFWRVFGWFVACFTGFPSETP